MHIWICAHNRVPLLFSLYLFCFLSLGLTSPSLKAPEVPTPCFSHTDYICMYVCIYI